MVARPKDVKLFQFIGKDNIPFHTVIFPSSLLGTGEAWTTLHHMSSTEYLNYEGGKFSKSKGVGVFGTDARETGIPADVWRFYVYYNRPEKSDALFTWKDFQEKVNAELIGNLGNLVNRTLAFVGRFYGGVLPAGTAGRAVLAGGARGGSGDPRACWRRWSCARRFGRCSRSLPLETRSSRTGSRGRASRRAPRPRRA